MSVIFLAKGTCTLGITKRDKDGNASSSTQAQFTFDGTGGSIAVGEMDPDTKEIDADTVSIFGDWDAAGYLEEALKLLNPKRKVNIPDFKLLIQSLIRHDNVDICDHCYDFYKCSDCVIKDWKEEIK